MRNKTNPPPSDFNDEYTARFAEAVDAALAESLDPSLRDWDWPVGLPTGIRNDDYTELDEWQLVVPSWNAIPLREVVRAGRTVAVVDSPESAPATVVKWFTLPAVVMAKVWLRLWHKLECQRARRIFRELPEDLKRGALLN
jgi:hypothetical protein